MHYAQLIQIMVALVLVVGAPSAGPLPSWHTGEIFAAFVLVAFMWFLLVSVAIKKTRSSWEMAIMVERLQWASLIPLSIDLYFLDIKALALNALPFSRFPTLIELAGIALYIFYLIITWSTVHIVRKRRGYAHLTLSSELSYQLRMILPALAPYFVLAFTQDLLRLLPFAPLKRIMETIWFQVGFFCLFVMVMIFFVPPLIVRSWSCKPMPSGPLRSRIENFFRKANVRFADILLWPLRGGTTCTAAVLGIFPRWRYVLITPCLIESLSLPEIEAVLAHEASHIRHRHLLWYVFFVGAYSAILYRILDPLWVWCLSHPMMLDLLTSLRNSPPVLQSLLTVTPLALLVILYFRFLMGYFMRHFERQADLGVFNVHGHPWHLIQALEKVALLSGDIRDLPSWHHFSIKERVDFLSEAARNPAVVKRQELDLFRKKLAFILVSVFLVCLPWFLPVASWEARARNNFTMTYIDQVLSRGERQPEVYLFLGNFLMDKKEYARAEEAYKTALKLSPDDPELLNGLAWLYATAKDPRFLRPREALLLATKAVSMKPAPHILDTLAESQFINGYVKQAIRTEKEALKKAKNMKDYYEKQLARFQKKLPGASFGPAPPS